MKLEACILVLNLLNNLTHFEIFSEEIIPFLPVSGQVFNWVFPETLQSSFLEIIKLIL